MHRLGSWAADQPLPLNVFWLFIYSITPLSAYEHITNGTKRLITMPNVLEHSGAWAKSSDPSGALGGSGWSMQ